MRLKPTTSRHEGTGDEPDAPPGDAPPGVAYDGHAAAAGEGSIVVALSVDQPPRSEDEIVDERLFDRHIQGAIGAQLRMLYNDVATAPVPDRLVELLERLAAKADKS
jgi:hypothetical protein